MLCLLLSLLNRHNVCSIALRSRAGPSRAAGSVLVPLPAGRTMRQAASGTSASGIAARSPLWLSLGRLPSGRSPGRDQPDTYRDLVASDGPERRDLGSGVQPRCING
jgi:hypothetical protein